MVLQEHLVNSAGTAGARFGAVGQIEKQFIFIVWGQIWFLGPRE